MLKVLAASGSAEFWLLISAEVHNFRQSQQPELNVKSQSVPRSKHSVSVIQTSQLMLYREIIAVYSHIHTKQINTLCGQNVELLNVKLAVHIVSTAVYRSQCM